MRAIIQMILLAWADYRHERLLSLCSVLGLAAVITPLLILYGVKFGVVHTMTERMRLNPLTLEVTPVGSGSYTMADMENLRENPNVAFVQPRTRSIAATMELSTIVPAGSTDRKLLSGVALEPTAGGDPLLGRYGVSTPVIASPREAPAAGTPAPGGLRRSEATLRVCGVVLSAMCAERLGAAEGDMLIGRVERSYSGALSSARVKLRVVGVLPVAAQQKPVAYVPLPLLEATEDFRDGRAVPFLGPENGWTGEPLPDEPRCYPSFRLYARSLEGVTALRDDFGRKGISTFTQAEEIEQVMTLDRGLNAIFTLICAAAGIGCFLSTASSVFAAIRRKERTLGLLQLAGFSTGTIMVFPLVQTAMTALFGTVLAVGAYFGIAACINNYFANSLQGVERICSLLPEHFGLAFAIVMGISIFAALGPAKRSTTIEPSEVIRDV